MSMILGQERRQYVVQPQGIQSNTGPWDHFTDDERVAAIEDLNERNAADYALTSVVQEGFTPLEEPADYSFSEHTSRDIDGTLDEQAQAALSELAKKYNRAMHRVANQYIFSGRVTEGPTIDEGDVFQEAFLGLMDAALKWQPNKKSFLSYAMPMMAKHIQNYFDDCSTTVRLPRSVRHETSDLRTKQWQDYQTTGSFKWGAVALAGDDGSQVAKNIDLLHADSVANQMGTIDTMPGIGAGYFEDQRTQHAEHSITKTGLLKLIYPEAVVEHDQTSDQALKSHMEEVISDLVTNNVSFLGLRKVEGKRSGKPQRDIITTKEAQIIQLRFGLNHVNNEPKTVAEIANELRIGPQRVRQLLHRALYNIRMAAYKKGSSLDGDLFN